MQCLNPNCQEEVPDHSRYCVVCGADAKFPNVRAAERTDEVEALEQRVIKAQQDASLRGCEAVLNDFRKAVAGSSAVVCRPLGKLNDFLSNDNQLFATFYQGIHSDARLPEDNEWDRIRESADSLLFPYYYEELRFASLTLDGSGITGYGSFCIVLKESAIKERASIFEENSILFIKKRRIVIGDPIPLGYRANWENRDALAVAKLYPHISSTTNSDEYQSILAGSTATDGDFIEVQIYGPLHRRAVRHLVGIEPRHKADKVVLKSVLSKLKEVGATWEIRS